MKKETLVSKFVLRTAPLLLVLLLGSVGAAKAQSLTAFFGIGSATDKANGQSYDFFNSGTPAPAPALGGVFGVFGAEYMLNSHLGFGGEYAFRFTQQDYAGLGARPTFYDFNAVYQPLGNSGRFVPEIQGGIGGATVHFYFNQAYCVVSCQNFSTPLQNSNHFQVHIGGGVRIYVRGNLFIRPQIDLHYVPNFVEYGSNLAPQYTVAVGYTFGGR